MSHLLTAREREVLEWAAIGKSCIETSLILRVSKATVVFHLKNCIQKLEVSNKTSAVAKAISQGYISVPIYRRAFGSSNRKELALQM